MANPTKTGFLADSNSAISAAITTSTGSITDADIAAAVAAFVNYCNNISPSRKVRGRHIIDSNTIITFE